MPWFHWSELARRGLRWWVSYPLKLWYAKQVNANACGALAIGSLAERDFVRWGIDETKIFLLPYAIERLSEPDTIDPDIKQFSSNFKMVFLFLGRLCRGKGIDMLLRAFKQVSKLQPDVGLVLVGNDVGKGRYQRMAKGLGIDKQVLFRGMVLSSIINTVLYSAQVLVHPTRYDGWGVVLNEAASLGKPLISTDACGAAHHLIKPGKNGFRVPVGDWKALADAMVQYADFPERVVDHGRASRILFEEFTPERNALRLFDILCVTTKVSTLQKVLKSSSF